MSWAGKQIVASMGMRVDDGVAVDLRGGRGTRAFLVIGDSVEIMLGERHVRTLRDQAGVALGDMARVEGAERAVQNAHHAGAQALTAAKLARKKAEAARTAGAGDRADEAEQAAACAVEAAERAQAAALAAIEAMEEADEAAEAARAAATLADQAAGREAPGGGGTAPRSA